MHSSHGSVADIGQVVAQPGAHLDPGVVKWVTIYVEGYYESLYAYSEGSRYVSVVRHLGYTYSQAMAVTSRRRQEMGVKSSSQLLQYS